AGTALAAAQQGDRGPGVRSEGFAACRHADRDLGARPRQGGQYHRLPHRGSEPRQFRSQAKFELRHHRRRAPARRRRSAAGTAIQLEQPVRMRRVALGEIKPGAVVDGPILFDVDLGYEIDNMEGLSVHRSAGGETVLTLISDDNFSALQRTLLLQFTLVEPYSSRATSLITSRFRARLTPLPPLFSF